VTVFEKLINSLLLSKRDAKCFGGPGKYPAKHSAFKPWVPSPRQSSRRITTTSESTSLVSHLHRNKHPLRCPVGREQRIKVRRFVNPLEQEGVVASFHPAQPLILAPAQSWHPSPFLGAIDADPHLDQTSNMILQISSPIASRIFGNHDASFGHEMECADWSSRSDNWLVARRRELTRRVNDLL
jgi:hypothetical protein